MDTLHLLAISIIILGIVLGINGISDYQMNKIILKKTNCLERGLVYVGNDLCADVELIKSRVNK